MCCSTVKIFFFFFKAFPFLSFEKKKKITPAACDTGTVSAAAQALFDAPPQVVLNNDTF